MTQVKPTTKEQLVYYLLQNVSLGTYDRRFLSNLTSMIVEAKNPVTSNQSLLLDKIVIRYAKQLRRKEIDATEMTTLAWTTEVIESIPEYTDAFITIKDEVIELRCPYKKECINDIRSKELSIVWNKEVKNWTAPFCEEVLKHFIKCAEKHYHIIHYCKKTVEIINMLAEYEACTYWNPTLVKANGNYYISGVTSPLYDALGDIELSDNLDILAKLVCYGVKISDEVINDANARFDNSELVEFSTSLAPVLDCSDPQKIVDYFKEIKCDYVAIAESFGSVAKDLPALIAAIKNSGIPYLYLDKRDSATNLDFSKYNLPVLINTGLWASPAQNRLRLGAAKSVFLGNNKPVKIK